MSEIFELNTSSYAVFHGLSEYHNIIVFRQTEQKL